MKEDLGQLIKRLLARGERVVIVGDDEPMVILPLAEYDKLSGFSSIQQEIPYLEPIDPPQGAVEDDDQYFPEPI